jgi:aldose 1-epimerase
MTDRALVTVHLRDEPSALEAAFVPGAGMLCCSLRHRGAELLAQNAGVAAYAQHGKTMGIPLLYPWANRLAGFDYDVAEHSVSVPHDQRRVRVDENGLPIHGVIGGLMAWEPIEADAHAATTTSLAARLSWSASRPELFEVFPFEHELRYEARLHDGRLEIELTVHACGQDAVPLSFGFHPYLSPPGGAREHWLLDLPPMRALELDARKLPVGPAQLLGARHFELDALEFDDGFEEVPEPAGFSVTAAGRRVELTFGQGYPYAQVFAPRAREFICFEPMTAPTNALRSGEGLRLLAAGRRFTAALAVVVSDSR